MTNAKHTPTPWRVNFSDGSGDGKYITAKHDAIVKLRWGCSCCEDTSELSQNEKANRDFIVRACNNHDALVDELKRSHSIISKLVRLVDYYGYKKELPNLRTANRNQALADATK